MTCPSEPNASRADTSVAKAEAVPDTFAGRVAHFESSLLRYVGHLMGGISTEAEDVVQETFIRLHRAMGDITPIVKPSSWLFRVAHNLSMDALRKRQAQTRLKESYKQDHVPHVPDSFGGLDDLVRREAQESAMAALQTLPPEEKQVLLMKIIQGLTLREIAEIMDMKIGTVNYRLSQGLKSLSRHLKREGLL